MVRRLTEPRASRYAKQLNEPRRILVTVSDALYMAIWQKASQLQMPLSTVANLILSNEIDWHYRSQTVAVPMPTISDRMNNLNHKPTPEPMSDDAVDQACFKSYRDDGGQINNIKAWIEAGKPAPEQNR